MFFFLGKHFFFFFLISGWPEEENNIILELTGLQSPAQYRVLSSLTATVYIVAIRIYINQMTHAEEWSMSVFFFFATFLASEQLNLKTTLFLSHSDIFRNNLPSSWDFFHTLTMRPLTCAHCFCFVFSITTYIRIIDVVVYTNNPA